MRLLSISLILATLVPIAAKAELPQKITVAGDSITMAFAADCKGNVFPWDLTCFLAGERHELSWFDGADRDVNSIHKRYKDIDSSILANKKAAASGSKMRGGKNDFPIQAANIVAQSHQPDHVEVLLGGNDICNRDCSDPNNCDDPLFTDSQWRKGVQEGLDVLVSGLPRGATVFLGGVPRIQDLYSAGKKKQKGKARVNCQSIWKTFEICNIATQKSDLNGESIEQRLSAIAERQRRYNEILAEEAVAYSTNANGKNTRGVEVVSDYVDEHTPSTGTTPFGAKDINGGDCFHPSVQGQNKIADMMWLNNPQR